MIVETVSNIDRLRDLTEKLPKFPDKILSVPERSSYRMETGSCLGTYLYEDNMVGVHKWWSSAGTKFPAHAHDQQERIIIYKGRMNIMIDGKEMTVGAKEDVCLEAGTPHRAYFPEDSEYVTVTIPSSEDFPHAR